MIAARRPLVRIAAWAACLLIGLTGGLSPALAAKRIELYDAEGQHHGYAIVQHRAGRVDYYNLRERRSGWGRVNPLNRIAMERMRYSEAVRDYNTRLRLFPGSVVASLRGFKEKAYFEAAPGSQEAPKVKL